MSELDLVLKLKRMAGRAGLTLGIGDDCAIFRPRANEELLFTTDWMIEDVHFRRAQSAESIGRRALARSLSDIASMGGTPRFCLVALAVPREIAGKWIERFYSGLLDLAKRTRTTLAGGDLSRAEKIHLNVMVAGAVPRGQAMRRDGARPGDSLCVSGSLGKPWSREIEPRLALGRSLRSRATSCIDVSDGLSLDLHRLCLVSKVAAEIDHIPIARGSTLERALNGGEDYELLFTIPSRARLPKGTSKIGTIVRGQAGLVRFQGKAIAPLGHDHFRNS